LWQFWVWEIERVEVPPDHFLVKINLWGKDLPEGEILAPDSSFKGVQRELLPEGRHFLNPLFYSYEKHKVTEVPPGKCLVLTRKAGKEISPDRLNRGEFLARGNFGEEDKVDDNGQRIAERGILEEVLTPGKYRINPYEYKVEQREAIEIRATQVGVKTLKWGKDPRTLPKEKRTSAYVVPDKYRGVQEKYVSAGTYYINPYVEDIVPVDIRSHPTEFSDIEFPSLDGFRIKPHVLVAYKVMPEKAPELFVVLCDQGKLHQEDSTEEQQKKNEILQKFVLPLIRGYVRIEGSKYAARDYVSQQKEPGAAAVNPREELQKKLMEKVAPTCREVGVLIESITVAQIDQNEDLQKLSTQIAEREKTRVTREKNKQLVSQHTQKQEQVAKEALVEQGKRVVQANTKLKVEQTQAEQVKEVEKAKLEAELMAAKTRRDAALDQAESIVTRGKYDASVITANNKAEVAELKTAVAGFPSAEQYAQYHMIKRLSPALVEIFASDQSDFARLFSSFMAPGKKPSGSASTSPAGSSGSTEGNTVGAARRDDK
jgi:hypothetical protein